MTISFNKLTSTRRNLIIGLNVQYVISITWFNDQLEETIARDYKSPNQALNLKFRVSGFVSRVEVKTRENSRAFQAVKVSFCPWIGIY